MVWSKSSAPSHDSVCWLLGFTVGWSLLPFDLLFMALVVLRWCYLADIDERCVVGPAIWMVSMLWSLNWGWFESHLDSVVISLSSCCLLYRLEAWWICNQMAAWRCTSLIQSSSVTSFKKSASRSSPRRWSDLRVRLLAMTRFADC